MEQNEKVSVPINHLRVLLVLAIIGIIIGLIAIYDVYSNRPTIATFDGTDGIYDYQIVVGRHAAKSAQAESIVKSVIEDARNHHQNEIRRTHDMLIETGRVALRKCHYGDISYAHTLEVVSSVTNPEDIYPDLTKQEIYLYCARNAYKSYQHAPDQSTAEKVLKYASLYGGPIEKINPKIHLTKIVKIAGIHTDNKAAKDGK